MAAASPLFRTLPLESHGLEWVDPLAALAHPLDDGTAAVLESSLDATAAGLGRDGPAYRKLFVPFVSRHQHLLPALLGPLRIPEHPFLLARFGLSALRSASGLANAVFETAPARALFAGCAAHSFLPFDRLTSSAIGLVLMLVAHVRNWPYPRGGRTIVNALGPTSASRRRDRNRSSGPIDEGVARSEAVLSTSRRAVVAIAGTPPRVASKPLRPHCLQARLALGGPSRPAARPAPSISVGRSSKSPTPSPPAGVEKGCRTSWSRSGLFAPPAPPPANTPAGLTATFPTALTLDMTGHQAQMGRFAPGFAIASSRAATCDESSYNEPLASLAALPIRQLTPGGKARPYYAPRGRLPARLDASGRGRYRMAILAARRFGTSGFPSSGGRRQAAGLSSGGPRSAAAEPGAALPTP
jgi:hypothetical protein